MLRDSYTAATPTEVSIREEEAEVEVGIESISAGVLLFPAVPKLLRGEPVPAGTKLRVEPKQRHLFDSDSLQWELERLLARYDEFRLSSTYLTRVASLLLMSGDLDRAFKFSVEAAEVHATPENRSRVAEVAYLRSDMVTAEKIWRELAQDGYMDAILRMAQLAITKSDENAATAWVDRALAIGNIDWRVHVVAGTLALSKGEHHQAVRHFRVAREDRPRSVQLHYNLALAHVLSGNSKNALRALRIAVGLNPFSPKVLVAFADVSAHFGRSRPEASAALSNYVSLHPLDKVAVERFAYLRYLLGDVRGAEEILTRARVAFNDPGISNNLGVIADRGRNFKRAIREFTRALEFSLDSPEDDAKHISDIATTNLVIALMKARQFDRAEKVAGAYVEMDDEATYLSSDPMFRIADCYVQALLNTGETDKAISLASKWLGRAIHPDLHSSLANTLVCHYALVERQLPHAHDLALQSYRLQSTRDPRDPQTWNITVNNLAFVLIEQGQLDAAQIYLNLLRSDVTVHKHYEYATRGLLAMRRGQVEKGEGLYRLAIANSNDRDRKSLFRQKLNWELGQYWNSRGNPRRASRFFEKVLRTRVTGVWTLPYIKKEAAAILENLRSRTHRHIRS